VPAGQRGPSRRHRAPVAMSSGVRAGGRGPAAARPADPCLGTVAVAGADAGAGEGAGGGGGAGAGAGARAGEGSHAARRGSGLAGTSATSALRRALQQNRPSPPSPLATSPWTRKSTSPSFRRRWRGAFDQPQSLHLKCAWICLSARSENFIGNLTGHERAQPAARAIDEPL
jgi:hypothetical protein